MEASRSRRGPWLPVGVAAATAFVLLAAAIVAWGGLAFDAPVFAAVQCLPVSNVAWDLITQLGGGILVPIGIALWLWAFASGRIRLALIVAVVLLGAALFADVVKVAIARPRPPGAELLETGFSFPSGHSLNSAATYGLLAVVVWRSAAPSLARRLAVMVALVVPLLVGLSRVAIGVHYPSDVLGGWSAGIALVAAGATAVTLARAMVPGTLSGAPMPGSRKVAPASVRSRPVAEGPRPEPEPEPVIAEP